MLSIKGLPTGRHSRGDESLRRLLTGMFNDRPPTRPQVPAWDLNTVLEFLSNVPFEPLGNATLKNLTFKTVMLVALASGHRCSEIQAISASASVFVNDGVNLFCRTDFVPKNETSSFKHTPLFLPKIGMHSSVREDRLWCPVRALCKYLQRTSNLKEDNDQLFLTYVEPHRPAAIRTVARWLVAVLVDFKVVDSSSHPRVHSTRAVASSWGSLWLVFARVCRGSQLLHFRQYTIAMWPPQETEGTLLRQYWSEERNHKSVRLSDSGHNPTRV